MNNGTYKWNATIDGHAAVIDATVNGATLTGKVTSPEYGSAPIMMGAVSGQVLTGEVTLHDNTGKVTITVGADGSIAGAVRVGWFFSAVIVGTKAP